MRRSHFGRRSASRVAFELPLREHIIERRLMRAASKYQNTELNAKTEAFVERRDKFVRRLCQSADYSRESLYIEECVADG